MQLAGEEQCKRRRTTQHNKWALTPVNIHLSRPDIPVPGVRYRHRSQDEGIHFEY